MMMPFSVAFRHAMLVGAIALLVTSSADSQQLPIRPLGPVVARSSTTLLNPVLAIEMSDGRVVVSDFGRSQISVFDGALGGSKVILDYSGSAGAARQLIPYRGDSILVLDRVEKRVSVLTGSGAEVRIIAIPTAADLMRVRRAGWSDVFGLIYSGSLPISRLRDLRPARGAPDVIFKVNDSIPIVAQRLAMTSIDTLAWYFTGRSQVHLTPNAYASVGLNFYPTSDNWTVTSDGELAILRTREYRVDRITSVRSNLVGPPIPFEWTVLTPTARSHLVDSANTDPARTSAVRTATSNARPFVDLSDVPERVPAVSSNNETTPLADRSNNVWIPIENWHGVTPESRYPLERRPTLYHVVNRTGELVDRVLVPAGRTIIGFGAGETVFLQAAEGSEFRIEKSRIR